MITLFIYHQRLRRQAELECDAETETETDCAEMILSAEFGVGCLSDILSQNE